MSDHSGDNYGEPLVRDGHAPTLKQVLYVSCTCGWSAPGVATPEAATWHYTEHIVAESPVIKRLTGDRMGPPTEHPIASGELSFPASWKAPMPKLVGAEFDPRDDMHIDSPATRVGIDVHSNACVDEEGDVECVCGLDGERS